MYASFQNFPNIFAFYNEEQCFDMKLTDVDHYFVFVNPLK